MTASEIVAAAALAYGAYDRLMRVATAQGMSVQEFESSVAAECRRLDAWVARTDAAEDAVFNNAPDDHD